MSFYKELAPYTEYLHSLRKLESYLSFDMKFPMNWGIPKSITEEDKIVPFDSGDQSLKGISFISTMDEREVSSVMSKISKVIKLNKDREVKEKLFKETIDVLKRTFETTDLETLKNLYFDFGTPKMEEHHLNWLKSEQKKDQRELGLEKQKLIKQIKKLNKEDLFPKQPKLTIWQRLRIAILGQ